MEKINIFDAIESNKRNSFLLMFLVCALLFASILILGSIFEFGDSGFIISIILTLGYVLFAYFAGTGTILSISGAREVKENEEPFLRNIVEGLAIASNIPKPKIWIIEDGGLNAFATGMDPKNSHVVFTRGLLKNLKKEEIEGVVAHEISHIANYDVRLTTLAVIMVGAIALIGQFALRFMVYTNRRGKGGAILIALLFAILVPLFGELVTLAISRQREYLADANGAKLMRYPEGLACALEKIKGHSAVANATSATASLYISDPFEEKFASLFATHPPIDERIKRLRAM